MRTQASAILDAFDEHLLRAKADTVVRAAEQAADARIRAAITTHLRSVLLDGLDHDAKVERRTRSACARVNRHVASADARCNQAVADLAQAARRVRSRHWREGLERTGTRTMIRAVLRALDARSRGLV